jgi:hypothetical protein
LGQLHDHQKGSFGHRCRKRELLENTWRNQLRGQTEEACRKGRMNIISGLRSWAGYRRLLQKRNDVVQQHWIREYGIGVPGSDLRRNLIEYRLVEGHNIDSVNDRSFVLTVVCWFVGSFVGFAGPKGHVAGVPGGRAGESPSPLKFRDNYHIAVTYGYKYDFHVLECRVLQQAPSR